MNDKTLLIFAGIGAALYFVLKKEQAPMTIPSPASVSSGTGRRPMRTNSQVPGVSPTAQQYVAAADGGLSALGKIFGSLFGKGSGSGGGGGGTVVNVGRNNPNAPTSTGDSTNAEQNASAINSAGLDDYTTSIFDPYQPTDLSNRHFGLDEPLVNADNSAVNPDNSASTYGVDWSTVDANTGDNGGFSDFAPF